MNNQKSVPTFEQLLDWLEGRLSDDEAQHVANLLSAANDSTQADAAWLRAFFAATNTIRVTDPPADVVERVQRQFAAHPQKPPTTNLWQRLVGTLTFDSYSTAAAGARAAGVGEQRQFLYETGRATVVFTLQRRDHDELYDLMGQVLPTDDSDVDLIQVSLVRDGVEYDSGITDDLGEFIFPAIPLGQYDLLFGSSGYEIMIPSIDLFI